VNNWLAETLAGSRRKGSGFLTSSCLNKKTAGKLAFLRVYLQLERLHDAAVNFCPF
jgi:hypothetical protein